MESAAKMKKKQMMIAFGGLGLFIVVLIFGMWLSDPNAGKPSPLEVQRQKALETTTDYTGRSSAAVSAEETWIARSTEDLEALKQSDAETKKLLNDLIRELKNKNIATETQEADLLSSALPSVNPIPVNSSPAMGTLPPAPTPVQNAPQPTVDPNAGQQIIRTALPPPPSQTSNRNRSVDESGQPISLIQVIDFGTNQDDEGEKRNHISHYFPTGSLGTVVLLSGMDAPTGGQAKAEPVPVLLRMMDSGTLANYFQSDVANCHIIGFGHGDISSERVKIRTETITCILEDGGVVEEELKGFIAGEDGKEGMRGRLVSKQGSLIAKSLLAGVASGMSQSISQQYQTVSTSPLGATQTLDPSRVGEAGLASGASNALEKIADYYIQRANETYPIIEIDANRIGEVILFGGTDFGADVIGNTRQRR